LSNDYVDNETKKIKNNCVVKEKYKTLSNDYVHNETKKIKNNCVVKEKYKTLSNNYVDNETKKIKNNCVVTEKYKTLSNDHVDNETKKIKNHFDIKEKYKTLSNDYEDSETKVKITNIALPYLFFEAACLGEVQYNITANDFKTKKNGKLNVIGYGHRCFIIDKKPYYEVLYVAEKKKINNNNNCKNYSNDNIKKHIDNINSECDYNISNNDQNNKRNNNNNINSSKGFDEYDVDFDDGDFGASLIIENGEPLEQNFFF
jgi:hypothetical protein